MCQAVLDCFQGSRVWGKEYVDHRGYLLSFGRVLGLGRWRVL
uniref:Uncharacterized protein n=1 Tax=Anguilla anguilla TaxID=7936 RepID=A0A0E9SC59_ANGAN